MSYLFLLRLRYPEKDLQRRQIREQHCTGVFQSRVDWTLWDQEQGVIAWECKLQTFTQGNKRELRAEAGLARKLEEVFKRSLGSSLVYSVFHPFLILQVRSECLRDAAAGGSLSDVGRVLIFMILDSPFYRWGP